MFAAKYKILHPSMNRLLHSVDVVPTDGPRITERLGKPGVAEPVRQIAEWYSAPGAVATGFSPTARHRLQPQTRSKTVCYVFHTGICRNVAFNNFEGKLRSFAAGSVFSFCANAKFGPALLHRFFRAGRE